MRPQAVVLAAPGLLDDPLNRGAVVELPLVGADVLDRLQIGGVEGGGDLLDGEVVVALDRFALAQVVDLVEDAGPAPMRSLVGLDGFELRLSVEMQPVDQLELVGAVVAGERLAVGVGARGVARVAVPETMDRVADAFEHVEDLSRESPPTYLFPDPRRADRLRPPPPVPGSLP